MRLWHKLVLALNWTLPASAFLALSALRKGWALPGCWIFLLGFVLAGVWGMAVSLLPGKKLAALRIVLSFAGGGLLLVMPGLPVALAGRLICAPIAGALAVVVTRACSQPREKAFPTVAVVLQVACFAGGYTLVWMLGISAQDPTLQRNLVFLSQCGLVWLVLNIMVLGGQAIRRSARVVPGQRPSASFWRRGVLFVTVYLVLVLVIGFFPSLNSAVTRGLRWLFAAIVDLWNRLFPTEIGEWTVPQVSASAGPGGIIVKESDPTVANIIFFTIAFANLAFWTVVLIRFIIRRLPQWLARLQSVLQRFFKGWKEQPDGFDDASENLFSWDAVRQSAGDAVRRMARRLRRPKRLSDCADNTERIRLLYQRYLQRQKKAQKLDRSRTPLEEAGAADSPGVRQLAQEYSRARYEEKEPDDAAIARLGEMRK
ncbi:MAG: hypothetical protein PHO66_00075 [Eubacteriales bacterium]|nr:hypothetical protein [Eubacteriales bacterium]